jgi:hypothetical protein
MLITMLQAHSFLWHYLWLAPGILLLCVAAILYRRGFGRVYPAFLAYTIYQAIETITLYTLDVLPTVSAKAWWLTFWVGLVTEGFLKFAVVAELLRRLLASRITLAPTGKRLFGAMSFALAMIAAAAAAYTKPANPHWLVGGGLILQQTLYIVQCGLILLVFVFAAFFRLRWERLTFGIALGFGVVFSQHLAARAVMAAFALSIHTGVLLSFLNMATYHVCVLIWCYYLLVPEKKPATSAVSLPENDLAIWNRELERLLGQ